MGNHGGARPGAGRKKGVSRNSDLKKIVDDCFFSLYEKLKNDSKTYEKAINNVKQIELDLDSGGWVYLIHNKNNDNYKIGVTAQTKPKQRFN